MWVGESWRRRLSRACLLIVVVGLAIAAAAGCGDSESADEASATGTTATRTTADRARASAPETKTGAELFDQNCDICHRLVVPIGAAPWYERLHAPDLSQRHVGAARVRRMILQGSGRMPALHLRARQIHLIARYVELESHRPRNAPVDRRRRVDGIAVARGRQLFQGSCGTCHALADARTPGDYGESLEVLEWRVQDIEPSLYYGLGLMPSVHLSMAEIERLARYVARHAGTRSPSAQQ
jgi:mono/diheme cytochrome c family protein